MTLAHKCRLLRRSVSKEWRCARLRGRTGRSLARCGRAPAAGGPAGPTPAVAPCRIRTTAGYRWRCRAAWRATWRTGAGPWPAPQRSRALGMSGFRELRLWDSTCRIRAGLWHAPKVVLSRVACLVTVEISANDTRRPYSTQFPFTLGFMALWLSSSSTQRKTPVL